MCVSFSFLKRQQQSIFHCSHVSAVLWDLFERSARKLFFIKLGANTISKSLDIPMVTFSFVHPPNKLIDKMVTVLMGMFALFFYSMKFTHERTSRAFWSLFFSLELTYLDDYVAQN